MPFDPNLPAHGSPDSSAEMRSQFTGLFDLIQSIPVGPPGPPGPLATGYVIDGVSTLEPGQAATVGVSSDGTNVHFVFGIPQGSPGLQGAAGLNGSDGATGPTGPQGPAFANSVVDMVTTLEPGEAATVLTSFDGSYVHFSFAIPRGNDGAQGPQGIPGSAGPDGPQGPQGPPGTADLSGTAVNPSISDLALTVSDPPTQTEMQQVVAKLNELMAALRRPII